MPCGEAPSIVAKGCKHRNQAPCVYTQTRRRIVSSKIFNNVVLNERVFGPAVDGKVAVAVGVIRSGV